MMNGNASQMKNIIPWLTWLLRVTAWRVTAPYSFLCWFCHLDLSMEVYMIWGIFAEVNFVAYRKNLRRYVLDYSAWMNAFPERLGDGPNFFLSVTLHRLLSCCPVLFIDVVWTKQHLYIRTQRCCRGFQHILGLKKCLDWIRDLPRTVYLTQVWRVTSREEKLGHVNWIRLRSQLSMHWNTVINNTEMNRQIACWCCVCVM